MVEREQWLQLRRLLPPIQVREVLEAAASYKISRIYCRDDIHRDVIGLLQSIGLSAIEADFRIIEHVDEGKGGWHNTCLRTAGHDPAGLVYLYLGRDPNACRRAKQAEADNDDETFGRLLRIPACCRRFFLDHRDTALERYFDEYATLIAMNTTATRPYDARLNYLAQYFGYSLISHYPCSFSCAASIERADVALSLLTRIDGAFASEFVAHLTGMFILIHRMGVLHVAGSFIAADEYGYDSNSLAYVGIDMMATPLAAGSVIRCIGHDRITIDDVEPPWDDYLAVPFRTRSRDS